MGKKVVSVLVVLSGTNAFAGGIVAMPEPSALPELLLTLAGVACLVWLTFRRRRAGISSVPGGTKVTNPGQ
jgi:hypothetical protein